MIIRPAGPAAGPARPSTTRRTTAGFSLPESAGVAETSGPAALLPMNLDLFLSLQEVESPQERNRKARRHAESMLAALHDLQRALLGVEPAPDLLDQLANLAGNPPIAADPALRSAVSEISVRLHVALAMAEMAGQQTVMNR